MDRSATELAFLAGGGLAANAAAGVHGLDHDAAWAGVDPADWRDLPEPSDADLDDDEDEPIGDDVLDLLGFDPDEEDEDEGDEDELPTEVLGNAFCATGPGGGIDPTCSPGKGGRTHNLHTATGLVGYLQDHLRHPMTAGQLAKVAHMHPNGVQGKHFYIPYPYASVTGQHAKNQEKIDDLVNLLPDGTQISTKQVTQKTVAGGAAPMPGAARVAGPAPRPSSHLPQVPYQPETRWDVMNKNQAGTLNGVDFAPAPPKFWEHVKDVDVNEPPPLHKLDRASVLVREPDGRIWLAHPTDGFSNRKVTTPGGTLEPGLSVQQNALKEVWEETGLQVKITGYLGDFADSNYGQAGRASRYGRLYLAERVGGQPWDIKQEPNIPAGAKNGSKGESEEVSLVTPERAAQLLHRTDDLAHLMTIAPVKLDQPTNGAGSEPFKKFWEGIKPAVEQYRASKQAKGLSPGVPELHAVQSLRGFNGRPKIVSKADMDTLVQQGTHVELLRGVKDAKSLRSGRTKATAKQLADDFKTGDHYPGFGIYGAGTYADATRGGGNVATNSYGVGGEVIRMALPKTARIVNYSDLMGKIRNKPDDFHAKGTTSDSYDNWRGVIAAAAGYDAIRVDGQGNDGYHVILNRSILTVQRESANNHVIK